MNKKNLKEVLIYLLVVIMAVVFIVIGHKMCSADFTGQGDIEAYTAKVTNVGEIRSKTMSLDGGITTIENKEIPFSIEFTGGPFKGETDNAIQFIDGMYMNPPKEVTVGDNIIVTKNEVPEQYGSEWIFVEHNRSNYLIILCVVFLLLIVLIGRSKGFSTILSLVSTVAVIFLVYIPSILKGYNIYLSTIITCVYIIVFSLIILNGINKKTLCAILGNFAGLAIAGILAVIMNNLLNITGFINENYFYLASLDTGVEIDLRAVVWGGVVIGSLGAIMDVAMSIASSMNELSIHMHENSFMKILKSGMNIGKDAIGTMTNTLILAYIGGSLAMVLLLTAYNRNILYLLNLEMIVIEVVQAVVGSMGILFAVPATAVFAAYIFNKKK